MDLFKRLFRHSDKDRFANLVRAGMIESGEGRPIDYDPTGFAFRLPGREPGAQPGTIYLHNVFASYQRTRKKDRPAELKRVVASITEMSEPLPDSFEAAAAHFLPQVRPLSEQGIFQLHAQLEGSTLPEMPCRAITPEVAAWLAYDRPESITRVSAAQLARWGIDFDTVFHVALDNLRRCSEKPFVALAPGLYGSDWYDKYDTSRVLLTDIIARLPVRGAPLAMIPNRDILLITGARDPDGLRAMVLAARHVLGDPRPLGADAVVLEYDTWRAFMPDPSKPGEIELLTLQEEQTSRLYAEQKALLDQIHEKTRQDIFVANYGIQRDRETDSFMTSIASWAEGVDSLLPKTRTLALVQRARGRIIGAPWDEVVKVASDLMEPMGWRPERFRVRRFPTDAQVDRLVAASGVDIHELKN